MVRARNAQTRRQSACESSRSPPQVAQPLLGSMAAGKVRASRAPISGSAPAHWSWSSAANTQSGRAGAKCSSHRAAVSAQRVGRVALLRCQSRSQLGAFARSWPGLSNRSTFTTPTSRLSRVSETQEGLSHNKPSARRAYRANASTSRPKQLSVSRWVMQIGLWHAAERHLSLSPSPAMACEHIRLDPYRRYERNALAQWGGGAGCSGSLLQRGWLLATLNGTEARLANAEQPLWHSRCVFLGARPAPLLMIPTKGREVFAPGLERQTLWSQSPC